MTEDTPRSRRQFLKLGRRKVSGDGELGTREGSELVNRRTDELRAPTKGPSDRSIQDQMAAQDIRAKRAAHSHRRAIVRWTIRTVCYLAFMSTVFMGGYIWFQRGNIEASVMIAFFSSVVTETIGILYVITRNLFPDLRAQPSKQESPSIGER